MKLIELFLTLIRIELDSLSGTDATRGTARSNPRGSVGKGTLSYNHNWRRRSGFLSEFRNLEHVSFTRGRDIQTFDLRCDFNHRNLGAGGVCRHELRRSSSPPSPLPIAPFAQQRSSSAQLPRVSVSYE